MVGKLVQKVIEEGGFGCEDIAMDKKDRLVSWGTNNDGDELGSVVAAILLLLT